ncbi:uncharacterized protein LOC144089405 [Stigmatopora argus]
MSLSLSLLLCYICCTAEAQTLIYNISSVPHLEVTPDNPVTTGQNVILNCTLPSWLDNCTSYLERKEEEIWNVVIEGTNLTLSEPQQSGIYRCLAQMNQYRWYSRSHAVYIVCINPLVNSQDNVGIGALALSLLAVVMNMTTVFWLCWQRARDKGGVANTGAKGLQRSGKDTTGGLPQLENAGQVYMNYSNTNLTYTDLDPTRMNSDSTYSVLS